MSAVGSDLRRAGRTVTRAAVITAVVLAPATLTACSSGPSTRADVCSAYDDLGRQLLKGNGVFDNPVFDKADDLAGVAKRYQDANLSSDASALRRIAKSDSTSDLEIMNATSSIANLCGHSLGLGDSFGD